MLRNVCFIGSKKCFQRYLNMQNYLIYFDKIKLNIATHKTLLDDTIWTS